VDDYFRKRWDLPGEYSTRSTPIPLPQGPHERPSAKLRVDRGQIREPTGEWVFYTSSEISYVGVRSIETFLRRAEDALRREPYIFFPAEVVTFIDSLDYLISPWAMEVIKETKTFNSDRLAYVPSSRMLIKPNLPRNIHGKFSTSEGIWSIQEIRSLDDLHVLEDKEAERGFFRELLLSNYTEKPDDALISYYHDKDHIRIIRNSVVGMREFRPMVALHWSEFGTHTPEGYEKLKGFLNIISTLKTHWTTGAEEEFPDLEEHTRERDGFDIP